MLLKNSHLGKTKSCSSFFPIFSWNLSVSANIYQSATDPLDNWGVYILYCNPPPGGTMQLFAFLLLKVGNGIKITGDKGADNWLVLMTAKHLVLTASHKGSIQKWVFDGVTWLMSDVAQIVVTPVTFSTFPLGAGWVGGWMRCPNRKEAASCLF